MAINIYSDFQWDICLITDDGITYYKEKRFLWFRWLKEVTQ